MKVSIIVSSGKTITYNTKPYVSRFKVKEGGKTQ